MKKLFFLLTGVFLFSAQLHFSLYKKEGEKPGNTLLVIGGIHGNEPGGYYAPSFLVRYYTVTKGSLWVVPNLNFDSIVKFRRGIYGDMNRKFAKISKNDKDYKIVRDIQKIILNPQVDMILNLHDGHGFYRGSWQNSIFNPAAWGQACIIDQEKIKTSKFGDLGKIAAEVSSVLNTDLKKNFHYFNVKNTKTKFQDEQMRLSLTYFAITHNKPAFAIETSKNIKDLPTKIYYQLRAIEEFMKIVGIEYKRNFKLSIPEIKKLLNKDDYAIINNAVLPLKNISQTIRFFPLANKNIQIKSDNPLVALVKEKDHFVLYEGFHRLSVIYPQYFKNLCKIKDIKVNIDGKIKTLKIPCVVEVNSYFEVLNDDKRINVIGFSHTGNEAGIKITKKELMKKYSVDKDGNIYRVEIYQNNSFCGMFLVRFKEKK